MKKIFWLIAVVMMAGCTDGDKATSVLSAQGYKNIQITGYNPFACSQDDFYHTGFSAITPSGQQVSGTVCSGVMFKGSTIRFD